MPLNYGRKGSRGKDTIRGMLEEKGSKGKNTERDKKKGRIEFSLDQKRGSKCG